jgi:hypothetical protein
MRRLAWVKVDRSICFTSLFSRHLILFSLLLSSSFLSLLCQLIPLFFSAAHSSLSSSRQLIPLSLLFSPAHPTLYSCRIIPLSLLLASSFLPLFLPAHSTLFSILCSVSLVLYRPSHVNLMHPTQPPATRDGGCEGPGGLEEASWPSLIIGRHHRHVSRCRIATRPPALRG